MDLIEVTAPTVKSVSLEMVKANSRVLHSREDELLGFLIEAAQDYISRQANISIMQRTLRLRVQGQHDRISLPRPPMIDLSSVTIVDEDDQETTLTSADYKLRKCNMLDTIVLDEADYSAEGTVEIEYTAGYATAETVPPALRRGVMLLASHWYTSREAAFMDARIMDIEKEIPFGVTAIIKQFMVPNTQTELTDRTGIQFV